MIVAQAWRRLISRHPPMKENGMSKTWEHYHHAGRHHEKAAYHYKEAAKYYQAGELEKAAHHAYLAHGHNQHAIHHDAEAAKLHAESNDSLAIAGSKSSG
jgi:Flp pilus assembly protein TadD